MSQSEKAIKKNTPKRLGEHVFSRQELVGKFPQIRHQPAPKASKYMLTAEQRDAIVAQMILR